MTLERKMFIWMLPLVTVPCTAVPFFSSTVTVSPTSFIRKLQGKGGREERKPIGESPGQREKASDDGLKNLGEGHEVLGKDRKVRSSHLAHWSMRGAHARSVRKM